MTLRMKYPFLSQFVSNNFDTNDDPDVFVDKTLKLVAYCMDTVFTKEEHVIQKITHQMKENNSLNN